MNHVKLKTPSSEDSGIIILGYGPQGTDFFAKAAKLCGSDAIVDPDLARMAGANFAVGNKNVFSKLQSLLEAGALEAVKVKNPGLSIAAQKWLASGERGISSNAMFTHITGVDASGTWGFDPPCDPDDFRRCRLLLEQVPELVENLGFMRSVSPTWACLVDDWEIICTTMDEETPNWRNPNGSGQFANATYKLIKQAAGR